MKKILVTFTLSFWGLFCLVPSQVLYAGDRPDLIARVGDQAITLTEIDTMINSSSIVGISIPAPGTPERNKVRLTILDKVISADLLYLDALKKRMNQNPVYRHDVARFSDSMLAALYKQKDLVGELPVTEKEIQAFYQKNIKEGTNLTDDLRLAIESTIRKKRFKEKVETIRKRLRKGVRVTVWKERLSPAGDADRKNDTVVAEVDQKPVHWGQVRDLLTRSGGKEKDRVEKLNRFIDHRIMVRKARAAGLDHDPAYRARVREFEKTRLVNIYRSRLIEKFAPDDREIRAYYREHRDRIAVPEYRKVQMVVLKTRKEAEKIKKEIESGKMTIYEAARDVSIDPNAGKTLGEIGWVPRGSGFPKLDQLTFSLEKGKLGGPVESPAGWHLVKVLDTRDALYQDINDKATWKRTRRMLIHEKLDHYTADLRKKEFKVVVYQDRLQRLLQDEADRVQREKERASRKGAPAGTVITGDRGEKK